MSKYDKYDEEIIKLANDGKRPCDISKEIGIDSRRIIERLKANNINYRKGNSNPLISIQTYEQEQVLIGTLLADGCLFKGKNNVNYRMNMAHGMKQKEYFMYKYEVLKSLGFNQPKIEKEYHNKSQKTYACIKTQSKTNPLFTNLYNKIYKNGKKHISRQICEIIDELALSIMFFDNGYNGKTGYFISMNNYDENSITIFRNMLLYKFGLETTLTKNNQVYIRAKSKEKFLEITKRYATKDVLYKFGELLENP